MDVNLHPSIRREGQHEKVQISFECFKACTLVAMFDYSGLSIWKELLVSLTLHLSINDRLKKFHEI